MIVRAFMVVVLVLQAVSGQDDAAARMRYAKGLSHLETAARWSEQNRELDALRELEQAEKLLPPSVQLYDAIGGAYLKLGDTRAVEYLRKAAELGGGDEAWQKLSDAIAVDKSSDAVRLIEQAVRKQPRNALLHILLGEACWRKSEFRKALEHFQSAAALKPGSARAHFGLGYTHQLLGDYGSAKAALETALRLDPDLSLGNLAYGHLLAAEGKWEEATAFLTKFAQARPNDVDVRIALAQIYLDHGRLDKAQSELESAARGAPEEKRVYYLLGRVHMAAGNKDLAEKEFAKFSRLEEAELEKARRVKNAPYYSKP